MFQACRGNYEMDGCFRQYSDGTLANTFVVDGLKKGHRFGLIASSDHGNGASYVGAFADSLDRHSIFSALHDRRTTFIVNSSSEVKSFNFEPLKLDSSALIYYI